MITTGVDFCNDMLHALPAGDGIPDTLSPTTIVTGREPPNVANLQLHFGDYEQLQMDNNPTNTMRPRHIDCITLHHTGTTQGSYYFMDRHSGKHQHGQQWTQCIMTEDVISRVEALGCAQKQPIMHDGPIATWRNGDPIAPAVASGDDADAGEDDDTTPDSPLFLPLPPPPIDIHEIDFAMVAPLQVVPVNVGAGNFQGAPVQGARALPVEVKEVEGEVYEVFDNERDAKGAAEGEVEGAQSYNLRGPCPPTFAWYDNRNGIEDLDLESRSNDSNVSIRLDFSVSIDDAPMEVDDSFDINLKKTVTERSRERTFGN